MNFIFIKIHEVINNEMRLNINKTWMCFKIFVWKLKPCNSLPKSAEMKFT